MAGRSGNLNWFGGALVGALVSIFGFAAVIKLGGYSVLLNGWTTEGRQFRRLNADLQPSLDKLTALYALYTEIANRITQEKMEGALQPTNGFIQIKRLYPDLYKKLYNKVDHNLGIAIRIGPDGDFKLLTYTPMCTAAALAFPVMVDMRRANYGSFCNYVSYFRGDSERW